jgi:endonuclease YncB( thermonuclease family)
MVNKSVLVVSLFGFLLVGLAAGAARDRPLFSRYQVQGVAAVTDGDTIRIAGERLRIFGIDAPEAKQTCRTEQGVKWACGKWATESLKNILQDQSVLCVWDKRDVYKRPIAQCQVGGRDLGGLLVERGIAVAFRKYSSLYVPLEQAAAARDLGLWSGTMQTPQMFRRMAQTSGPAPDAACAIKGNISKSGRIYHLPGSKWYKKTRIDTRKGERWFCSVSDALQAGWRAPRG